MKIGSLTLMTATTGTGLSMPPMPRHQPGSSSLRPGEGCRNCAGICDTIAAVERPMIEASTQSPLVSEMMLRTQ